ncbi:MAG: EamA family transporter [Eggerthellaceae bacterium]
MRDFGDNICEWKQVGDMKSKVARGVLFAIIGGVCWGFSGMCAQFLLTNEGIPAAWLTPVRLLVSGIIFLIIGFMRNRRMLLAVFRDKKSMLIIIAYSILGMALMQYSYLATISYTTAGVGITLERTGLVLIMLWLCLRNKRLPHLGEFIGLILALGGVCVLAFQGDISHISIPTMGLFWGGVSAISLVFYTLLPEQVLDKWGALIVTGLATFFGGAACTVTMQPWTYDVVLTPEVILGFAAIVVIGTLCAYLFFLQGIKDAGPMRAGLVSSIEPVAATFFSAIFLQTPVSIWDMLGCGMIVLMVFFVTDRKGAKQEAADETMPPEPGLFRGRASVLGYLTTRKAVRSDLRELQVIFAEGRKFLTDAGVHLGPRHYPSTRRLANSVEQGTCYVVLDQSEEIVAVFNFETHGDNYFDSISNGQWLTESGPNSNYAVVNWVSVRFRARRAGVAGYILGEVDRMAREAGKQSIRMNIYEGNVPMERLLLKHGYELCGSMQAESALVGTKQRTGYEHILQSA